MTSDDDAPSSAGSASVPGSALSVRDEERTPDADAEASSATLMLRAYRHDVHKLRGRSHDSADEEFAGVTVNESVPLGADRDAALLSRPRGEPEQTVANHASPYRLSLLTGSPATESVEDGFAVGEATRQLVRIDEASEAHRAWLASRVAGLFTESVFYPYTSVKYHTLLVAALLSNYRDGASFDDLHLVVDDPNGDPVPHRTVLWTSDVALRVTTESGGRPAARLGARPARSFADVWSRLSAHPGDVDGSRAWRVLDAQVRRIRSWSAALQYIEDYVEEWGDAL